MKKHRINNATVALVAFVLMLTIASMPFTVVSFAQSVTPQPANPLTNPVYPVPGYLREGLPSPWWSYGRTSSYNGSGGGYNPTSTAPSTSHMLWFREYGAGGVYSAEAAPKYGFQPSGQSFSFRFGGVMALGGKVVYGYPYEMVCVDEWTGEHLWTYKLPRVGRGSALGSSAAANFRQAGGRTGPVVQIYMGTTIYEVQLDTGDLVGTYEFPYTIWGSTLSSTLGTLVYCYASPGVVARTGYLYCYTLGGDLVWGPMATIICADAGIYFYDYILIACDHVRGIMQGINFETGEVLWTTGSSALNHGGIGYGIYYNGGMDGKMYAYNIYTGELVWRNTDITGSYWSEAGLVVGDGVVCDGSFDGRLYAFDAETGETKWTYYMGPCPYEPYRTWFGSWVFCVPPKGADGKFYAMSGQHGVPSTGMIPGEKLLCLDAQTGDLLWSYPSVDYTSHDGHWAIADGLLFAPDGYTNQLHCFGKGPTAVEVSVTQSQIVTGGYTWITGRVTDQSPAQPGTPCVSKESMDAWMAYLHAGAPEPALGTITGVPVMLFAVASDGTVLDLGTVTTDSQGYFQVKWTPPDWEQIYQVTATFVEDESYYGSWAATNLAVDPIVGPTSTNTTTVPEYLSTVTLAAVAVAIGISIVNLAALRKTQRNKGGIDK